MAVRNQNISLTLAGVLLLISLGLLGCSDNGDSDNSAKKSAEPAKGTMPTLNTTNAAAKPKPAEQPAVTDEAPTETATKETPDKSTPPATAEPASLGEKVYKSACFACHANGVAGAPKFGDAAQWKDRIAKGKDVLVKNAITGFTGSTGVMPPKGGFTHRSDEDIAAAVEYMMQAAQ
jgi:cytochrome c5